MIEEISRAQVEADFLGLLGVVEAGDGFDMLNADHVRWLRQRLEGREVLGARTFGDYAGGAPLGVIVAGFDEGPPGVGSFGHQVEILGLGVVETHRRAGVGTRLVRHVEALAAAAGYHCVLVSTYAGDAGAIGFYQRCGFHAVATIPDVHGPDDEGLRVLRKLLTA